MIKVKILTLLLFFKTLVTPIHIPAENNPVKKHPKYSIRKMGKMSEKINESSALLVNRVYDIDVRGFSFENANTKIRLDTKYTFWTLNDHGGNAELFEISLENLGDPKNWKIKHASNYDWEELAKDDKGNIYIGDFGNNSNLRRNLKIYKVNPFDSLRTDSICFHFSDQKAFPPSKGEMNFDCEAFFWYRDSLYLFSKNRGRGPVKVYKLPDQPGKQVAELFKEINISGMITSADISPDHKHLTLLSYGIIYFFDLSGNGPLDIKSSYCKKFPRSGQSEGVCFLDSSNLAISNEQGKIFFVRRKKYKFI